MANRVLAQKALKAKRQRRLFPRNYSSDYIPVGKPPVREVIHQYKEHARGLAFDDAYMKFLEAHARWHGVPPARKAVLDHIYRIQNEIPQMLFVLLADNYKRKTSLFFNSTKKSFIVMEQELTKGIFKTSMTYGDHDRILRAWLENYIRWSYVTQVPIESNPLGSPLA